VGDFSAVLLPGQNTPIRTRAALPTTHLHLRTRLRTYAHYAHSLRLQAYLTLARRAHPRGSISQWRTLSLNMAKRLQRRTPLRAAHTRA